MTTTKPTENKRGRGRPLTKTRRDEHNRKGWALFFADVVFGYIRHGDAKNRAEAARLAAREYLNNEERRQAFFATVAFTSEAERLSASAHLDNSERAAKAIINALEWLAADVLHLDGLDVDTWDRYADAEIAAAWAKGGGFHELAKLMGWKPPITRRIK